MEVRNPAVTYRSTPGMAQLIEVLESCVVLSCSCVAFSSAQQSALFEKTATDTLRISSRRPQNHQMTRTTPPAKEHAATTQHTLENSKTNLNGAEDGSIAYMVDRRDNSNNRS